MSYGINGETGYIVRFTESDLVAKTYCILADVGDAIRTGEALLRETNAESYWLVDQKTGKIIWERI